MRKLKKRIIICGHAASGKDYLAAEFINQGYKKDISKTTRPMRSGEKPGVTYKFVSYNDFKNSISKGDFFEHLNFNGWYYGTTLDSWNTSDIFIMAPSAIKKLPKEDREESVVLFIDIDRSERLNRISKRSDADSVTRRLLADDDDFNGFISYDYRETSPNFNSKSIVEFLIRIAS